MTSPFHNDIDTASKIHGFPQEEIACVIHQFNTLRWRQIGRYFADNIFKYILFN